MSGPCRCVPVVALARKSLKTLRRAGWRAGPCRRGCGCRKSLKTLSVAVRAGARVKNPHTPYSPKGSARALLTGLETTERSAAAAARGALKHNPATELYSPEAIPVGWVGSPGTELEFAL